MTQMERELSERFAREMAQKDAELASVKAQKDGAYSERNKLVAALSKMFPASLERHPDEDKSWEDDWRWIVFIDLPAGQASWHLHDSELSQFDHLKRGQGRKWDGHTTEEKYRRLAAFKSEPGSVKARLALAMEVVEAARRFLPFAVIHKERREIDLEDKFRAFDAAQEKNI